MASTASASSATVPAASTSYSRPQAGPLPSKPGEIGYREDLHGRDLERGIVEGDSRSVVMPLPERHPADRDGNEAAAQADTNIPLTPAAGVAAPTLETAESTSDSSSTRSKGKRSIIAFLPAKLQKIPTYGGIRLTTFFLFIVQIILIGATIAGWVLAVRRISQGAQDSSNANTQNGSGTGAGSGSVIFIHVVFAVVLIAQFLFVERRLFRLRAERYAYLHPGEMLPTSRHPSDASMGIAPWRRAPLPTYAAALVQSGYGTGDVEDHIIAVPPPPAYGQTRNSRLLLSGFLRNSLRAQRPISEHSQMSQLSDDRPMSYTSRDEQWQVMEDAERARKLEEALIALEAGEVRPALSVTQER